MASLDTQIQITAVDRTREAFASVQSSLSSLSSAVGALPGFAGIAASLAAFASAGAIKSLVADTISWAASMDDMAERTGATVEQLSSLAAQAKISGTDMATVEQGIIRLNKALAGGDDESKGAAHALKFIGLESEKLRQLDPAEAFRTIAVALSQFSDGGGKTAVAMDILGKSAAQLLPYMKDLAETGKINAKLSGEQAAAAEKLEKAWGKLSNQGGGLAKQVGLALMPAFAGFIDVLQVVKLGISGVGAVVFKVTNDIATFAQIANAAIFAKSPQDRIARIDTLLQSRKNFNDALLDDLKDQGSKFKSVYAEFQRTLDGADSGPPKPSLSGYKSRSGKPEKAARGAAEKADPQAGFLATIRERLTLAQAELEADGKLTEARKFRIDAEARLGEIIRKNPEISRATGQALIDEVAGTLELVEAKKQDERISFEASQRHLQAYEAAKKDAEAAFETTKALKAQNAEIGLSADELLRLKQARIDEEIVALRRLPVMQDELQANSEIAEQIKAQIKALEDRKAALEDGLNASRSWATGAKDAMNQYLDVTASAATQSRNLFTNAFKGMEDALVNFVKTGKLDFKSLADSIISDLIRIQVQENITKPLAKVLQGGGGFGDFFGSLFGGGSSSAPMTPATAAASMPEWFSYLPKYDTGTDYVPRDMIAMIHKGERIVPAAQNRPGYGGVNLSMPVTIDARGASSDVVPLIQQGMAQALAQMRREVPALLARQQIRNGQTPLRV